MNSKIALTIEIILLIAYLTTTIFFIDTKKTAGLIELGVLTAIIFGIVIVLEKKREAMKKEETVQPIAVEPATSSLNNGVPPTSSTPNLSMNSSQSIQRQDPSSNQSSFPPRQ